MDAVPLNGGYFDDCGEHRRSGCWGSRHAEVGLGTVGVMEGTRVVLAEPRVLEGVGAVNLVSVREEEPEVAEGFARDKLKAR
jgi:hypothetical protein